MKKLLILAFLAVSLAACAPQAKLTVLRPAEVDTSGITEVAVGPLEVAQMRLVRSVERNGVWKEEALLLSDTQKKSLAQQIRAQVIGQLAKSPSFELVYTDEFAQLENDQKLQDVIGAAGYKVKEAQAVISGKVWVEVDHVDGSDILEQDLSFISGGKGSISISVEKLVWWPYKSIRGNLTLQLKMTQIQPTQVLVVSNESRRFAQRIGGAPLGGFDKLNQIASDLTAGAGDDEDRFNVVQGDQLVLPGFEQLLGSLAGSITTDFARKVAITETQLALPVATGGDPRGKLLVEAGAYEMAIDHLQKLTAQEPKDQDLYNLGLAFEALGEIGLARIQYRQAFEKDQANPLYALGLGRLERNVRERPALKKQLSAKEGK